MITTPEGRWPPVYDAEDLARVIRDLISAEEFDARFWDLRPIQRGLVCQGDIVRLESAVPVIDEEGQPMATNDCEMWLAIGNTCDFERHIQHVRWTQLVPLVDLSDEVTPQRLGTFRRYEYSRHFYIPPWPGSDAHYFADLTRPVTVHKSVFSGPATVEARMMMPAWVLLHSCLIRFLARDDGRHDST